MTELNILTIPNGNGRQFKELADHLRPFIAEHNIILTTTEMKPVSLEQLEAFLLNMIEVVRSHKEPEPLVEEAKEIDPKVKEAVDKEVTELFKREGRL